MARCFVPWLMVLAGTACRFDPDGVLYAGPGIDAPIDTVSVCIPGCDDTTLVTCAGGVPTRTVCDLGCSTVDTPHCAVYAPSNQAPLAELAAATGGLTVPAHRTWVIETDTGRIIDFTDPLAQEIRGPMIGADSATGTVVELLSATVAVLIVDSLTVESLGELYGGGRRALIILARKDVIIRGLVDFAAGCILDGVSTFRCAGPGGGHGATASTLAGGCSAGGQGRAATGSEIGGGGGGGGSHGELGAGGGSGAGTRQGGRPGIAAASCVNETLVPLVGGSGGGAGGVDGARGFGGFGGGGGGALQISSLTTIVVDGIEGAAVNGVLFVGGGGGGGAVIANEGGGGGGSGGSILLEAPTVVIGPRGVLSANGGGGGSGPVVTPDGDGKQGPSAREQASGGPGLGDGDDNGAGGRGGSIVGAAMPGKNHDLGGGGGGGGAGVIRINGRLTLAGGSVVTPAHTNGPRPGQ